MNLLDLIGRDVVLKKAATTLGGEFSGLCPWCGGRDRFRVWPNDKKPHYWCRVCGKRGDDIDYARLKYNMSFKEAQEFVQRQITFSKSKPVGRTMRLSPPPTIGATQEHVQITMEEIKKYHDQGVEKALAYFGQYKINRESVDKFWLGYAVSPRYCSLPAGWTIPNISLTANGSSIVRACRIRRDDIACLEKLNQRSPKWIEFRLAELTKKLGREATLLDLVDDEWSAKYSSISTSEPGIFGDDLVTLPDDTRQGPRLPFIFVHEDEKSAILMRMLGYPAVAYKQRGDWNDWLPCVFRHITQVYIVADNDEKVNNFGKGIEIARKIKGYIDVVKISATRIVMSPLGFNDVADLARDRGTDDVRQWVQSNIPEIYPIGI